MLLVQFVCIVSTMGKERCFVMLKWLQVKNLLWDKRIGRLFYE